MRAVSQTHARSAVAGSWKKRERGSTTSAPSSRARSNASVSTCGPKATIRAHGASARRRLRPRTGEVDDDHVGIAGARRLGGELDVAEGGGDPRPVHQVVRDRDDPHEAAPGVGYLRSTNRTTTVPMTAANADAARTPLLAS
jgi:hypothetical protein